MTSTLHRLALASMRSVEIVSAILLLVVVALNLSQIFFRYVLVDPLSWSEETMRYLTIWMVMLAGSAALLRNEHMAIDLLGMAGSARLRRLRRLAVLVCISAFCLLLIWQGLPAAVRNFKQASPAMQVPMTLPYLAIPVGAALMLVKAAAMMVLPESALARFEREEGGGA